ncbi:TonB family protein [candidate division WOR-3 bacterium]|nr:TonB family protein [candidate division WOR-3 bacterium]
MRKLFFPAGFCKLLVIIIFVMFWSAKTVFLHATTPSLHPISSTVRKGIMDTLQVNGSEIAIITMKEGGKIYIKFFPEDAPNTVKNFIMLSRLGFYDGLIFHRVISNFVAQGGDPLGTGMGDAGYDLEAEFNKRHHLTGTLAMARAEDPNSASCQFYICLASQPGLDEQYTVFGQVIKGMDTVKKIKKGDVMKNVRIKLMDYKELNALCTGKIYTLPVPQRIKLPDYPEEIRIKGIEGNVVLRILINTEGKVTNVKIVSRTIHKCGTELDSLTIETAKTWKFAPAKILEEFVEDWIWCDVKFKIIDTSQCSVSAFDKTSIIK